MPHESTVGHEDILPADQRAMTVRSRLYSDEDLASRRGRLERSDSIVPNLYADKPRQFTQIQEDDDESSSGSEREPSLD